MRVPPLASGGLPVRRVPLSSFIPASLHTVGHPRVQNLLVPYPLKIEASTMRSPGRLAEVLFRHAP